MAGLYSLREANRSVQLAAVLFLLVLGYGYVFAFLMVKTWVGLGPSEVAAAYSPELEMHPGALAPRSTARTRSLDLPRMGEEKHRIHTRLLIQDSHIHLVIYAVVAALQTLIILGLDWGVGWRDGVIGAAFLAGALDFSGQWLIKAGLAGFAWLTLLSGWLMAAVYLAVLCGTLKTVFLARIRRRI